MFTLADTFGDRLKEERTKLGFTQEELAEKTGVRPLTIIKYEKSQSSPPVKFIYELQKIGFDPVYLLTATANPYIGEFSPKLLKEIASIMDQIELEIIGEPLASEARVKLTLIMLDQYVRTVQDKVIPFGFESVLTRFMQKKS